jgi:hypothetical protein
MTAIDGGDLASQMAWRWNYLATPAETGEGVRVRGVGRKLARLSLLELLTVRQGS